MIAADERRRSATCGALISLEKLGYSWCQDGASVTVYLPLTVTSKDAIECEFLPTRCSLRATDAAEKRYFFDLARTFAEIDPATSSVRVPKSRKHIVLKLGKLEAGLSWAGLRPP